MRIVMYGAALAAALLLSVALGAPQAEASGLTSVERALPLADVYVGFGYRSRASCRRYVRRTYYRRPAVRYSYSYSYSGGPRSYAPRYYTVRPGYGYAYPGYSHGYYARPRYGYSYGYGYPRASIGFRIGGHAHYGHHHHGHHHRGGSRRVVGRRR